MTEPDPVLDPARLAQLHAVLGASGVNELIDAFRRTATNVLLELSPGAERDVVRRAAHKLKGTAFDMGLIRLGTLMSGLQAAAETDGEMAALIGAAPAQVNAAFEALDRERR